MPRPHRRLPYQPPSRSITMRLCALSQWLMSATAMFVIPGNLKFFLGLPLFLVVSRMMYEVEVVPFLRRREWHPRYSDEGEVGVVVPSPREARKASKPQTF